MNSLVVDNTPAIRDSLCYILLSMGIKGLPCGSKEEALKILNDTQEEVVLAIIDIDNKATEGVELIKELKQNPKTKNIKIIVHTIQTNKNAVTKMIELGVIGYLLKPYQESETHNKLNKILKKTIGIEKRKYIRISPDPEDLLRVHFRIQGYQHLISGKIINLSMGGLAMELYSPVTEELLHQGIHVPAIQFTLGSKEIDPSGVVVIRKDKVVTVIFNVINQKQSLVLAKYIFKRISV
jgi:two-component system OmpR family response regulator